MTMKLAIRADASVEIGIGHVMRCLTLADRVRALGGACLFVCRPTNGNMIDAIQSRGHSVAEIQDTDNFAYGDHPNPPDNAHWLGGNWQTDADFTQIVASEFGAECLIVDHYALDKEWERRVRYGGVKILAIDDLADRPHDADVLLDQNFGRLASAYDDLVRPECLRLIGTTYAILRPEFAELRQAALEKRLEKSERNRLLISMGGIDKDNASGAILGALSRLEKVEEFQVSVVLGSAAPWLQEINFQAASLPFQTTVLVNVTDMAELMFQSDLCLGAGGSTTWERCCLALPTAMAVLADNQRETTDAIVQKGQALALDVANTANLERQLSEVIALMSDKCAYQDLAQKCAEITDGGGAQRVVDTLFHAWNMDLNTALGLLRNVEESDLDDMLEWRNSPDVRSMMFTKHEITSAEHLAWWEREQLRSDVMHLIYEFRGSKCGVLSFTQINLEKRTASWAFYASPDAPQGSGSRMEFLMLEEAFSQLGLKRLDCVVLEVNEKVRKLHERFGFSASDKARPVSTSEQSGEPIYSLSLHNDEWQEQRVSHQTRLLERLVLS